MSIKTDGKESELSIPDPDKTWCYCLPGCLVFVEQHPNALQFFHHHLFYGCQLLHCLPLQMGQMNAL